MKLDHKFLHSKFALATFGSYFVAGSLFWRSWNGILAGDDIPNSLVRYWTQYLTGANGFSAWIEQTQSWTKGWMVGQGRFFPTAVAISRGVFLFITSQVAYKFIQFFFIVLMISMISFVIAKIANNRSVFPLAILISSLLIQVRQDFDPYFSFSLLLPFAVISSLGLVLLISWEFKLPTRSKSIFVATVLLVLAFLCFTSYEYTILLSPAVYLLLNSPLRESLLSREKLVRISLVGTVSICLFAYTFLILRPHRQNHEASYEFSMKPVPFLKAFYAQASAPIPFSQRIFRTLLPSNSFSPLYFISIFLVLVFLIIPYLASIKFEKLPFRVFLSGLYFWFAPSTLVALTKRWQLDDALVPGKAYLPICFEVVGLTIIVVYVYCFLSASLSKVETKNRKVTKGYVNSAGKKNGKQKFKKELKRKSQTISCFDLSVISLVLAFLYTLSYQQNSFLLGNGSIQRDHLSILKLAAHVGFLDQVSDGDRVVNYEMNDASDINRAVLSVESGKDLSLFNNPQDFLPADCISALPNCQPRDYFLQLEKTQNRIVGNHRETIDHSSKWYFADVLFYTPRSAIFGLSPIVITDSGVFIDRSRTSLTWIKAKDSPIAGKKIGGKCVVPSVKEFKTIDHFQVAKLSISVPVQLDIMRGSQHGEVC